MDRSDVILWQGKARGRQGVDTTETRSMLMLKCCVGKGEIDRGHGAFLYNAFKA